MSRRFGCLNYNKSVVLGAVDEFLPTDNDDWKKVAARYQTLSGEVHLRHHHDIKRYFVGTLCDRLNCSDIDEEEVANRARYIQAKIIEKEDRLNIRKRPNCCQQESSAISYTHQVMNKNSYYYSEESSDMVKKSRHDPAFESSLSHQSHDGLSISA